MEGTIHWPRTPSHIPRRQPLRLRLRHRMGVHVPRLLHQVTDLDAHHPWMHHHVFDECAFLWIGLEHPAYQGATGTRGEVADCSGIKHVLILVPFALSFARRGRRRRGRMRFLVAGAFTARRARNRMRIFDVQMGVFERVGYTCLSICCVECVGCLCDAPGHFLKMETVVDDPACPDIDETGIVCWTASWH